MYRKVGHANIMVNLYHGLVGGVVQVSLTDRGSCIA